MRSIRETRSKPAARRGQVLILLVGYLFMGGSVAAGCAYLTGLNSSQIEKALDEVVGDHARREAAQATVADWAKETEAFFERTAARRERLFELFG